MLNGSWRSHAVEHWNTSQPMQSSQLISPVPVNTLLEWRWCGNRIVQTRNRVRTALKGELNEYRAAEKLGHSVSLSLLGLKTPR